MESQLWLLSRNRFEQIIEALIEQTQEALAKGNQVEAAALAKASRAVLEQYKEWQQESEIYRWRRDTVTSLPILLPIPSPAKSPEEDRRSWLLPHEQGVRTDEPS